VPGKRGDHFLGRREINLGCIYRQVIVTGVKPIKTSEGMNITASILVRALDHLNGISLASGMIDVHDPLHPEPKRGVNHDVEKLCLAPQKVKSAAAENHAWPFRY